VSGRVELDSPMKKRRLPREMRVCDHSRIRGKDASMSNSNLIPLVLTISICDQLRERLAAAFQDAQYEIGRLVQAFLAQPVTPEATAELEKICSTS